MRLANHQKILLLVLFVLIVFLPGCTNWKQKYDDLLIENENIKGQLDYERGEKGQLAEQYSQSQRTIDELRRQIEEQSKSPAVASGFGEGYDVAFNATAGTITVTLDNAILFDSGKAELKQATIAELDHIRSVLRDRYAGKQIDVVGHTDSDPIQKSNWKDNLQLSSERALTVTRYLIAQGIPEKEIRAVACGASLPVATNATAAGKAKNRRVEIVVHMR